MTFPALPSASALLLPVLLSLAPAPDGRPADEATLAVARLLSEDAPVELREPAVLSLELRELGDPALPALFDVLARGRAPSSEPGGSLGRALSPRTLEAVRGALLAASRSELRIVLRTQDRPDVDSSALNAALELAGEFATERDVDLLLDLARRGLDERSVRRGLRDALTRTYERDPRAVRGLQSFYRDAPHELLAPLVEATRAVEPTEAVEELARLLGAVSEADTLVLAEIGRRAPDADKPLDLAVTGTLRGYLNSADPNRAGAAIQALGALQDSASAADILQRMETSATLRRTCSDALRNLTGQRLGDDPRPWRAFLEAEERWWQSEARFDLRALATLAPADAAQSLLQVSRHLLYRHEIAPQLAAALRRPEVDLVVLCCSAMGHLGSRAGLEALIEQLDHPESKVRGAAHQALVKVCGTDHGERGAPWRENEL